MVKIGGQGRPGIEDVCLCVCSHEWRVGDGLDSIDLFHHGLQVQGGVLMKDKPP